jgi:hypothetical protein
MTATPFPAGTKISRTVGTEELGLALILDSVGADVLGLVTANPAAFSALGRLKTIADLLTAIGTNTDQLEGYLDTVEALLGTNNTATASTAPADDIFSITPSDSVALATVPKALLVLTAGNVAVRGTGNNPVTIPVVAGQILPIRARYVYATNTTATVVGLV